MLIPLLVINVLTYSIKNKLKCRPKMFHLFSKREQQMQLISAESTWKFMNVWKGWYAIKVAAIFMCVWIFLLLWADFFHWFWGKHSSQTCLQPMHHNGWRVTFRTVRFPNICVAGINMQGSLLGSVLHFSKGLCTAQALSL